MAISGVGVAIATAGGVLVYAGLRGTSPLDALREVVSGRTPGAVATTPAAPIVGIANVTLGPAGTGSLAIGAGPFPKLAQSAIVFKSDLYSQARRWENGYSDCSSFAGKAFRQIGIIPPGASTTLSYLGWSKLRKISRSEAGAGDLVVSTSHMAILLSPTTAIGQENPRRNVQADTIENIMSGTGAYVFLRYVGAAPPVYGPPGPGK